MVSCHVIQVFGKKKVEPVVKDAAVPGETSSVTVESQ